MNDTDAKIRALMERIDKLEHALLVLATWHHGQDEYVKNILGPEAVQAAEVEHGYCSDTPMFEAEKQADKSLTQVLQDAMKDLGLDKNK